MKECLADEYLMRMQKYDFQYILQLQLSSLLSTHMKDLVSVLRGPYNIYIASRSINLVSIPNSHILDHSTFWYLYLKVTDSR